MNSLFSRFGLVAVAICGMALALAACHAVEDVREQPSTPVPTEQNVVKGTVTGLGYRRPLVLQDLGQKRCTDPANTTGPKIYCTQNFFGNFDENVSHFSFGSVPVGTPYNITIKTQPFGKICTINSAEAQGTVTLDVETDISVSCVNDSSVARYCVGGTIPQAIHDIPGLAITLNTEEGLKTLSNDPNAHADGSLPPTTQSCWFPNSIFNSGSSLPLFRWYVTASFPSADGLITNNCRVTGGSLPTAPATSPGNSGSNDLGDGTVVPTGDVTNLSIPACDFTMGGTVGYSVPPVAGAPGAVAQPISGLVLGLIDTSGNPAKDVAGNVVSYAVPAVAAGAVPSFTFGGATPNRFYSNSTALYDVVVVTQPAGQFCLVTAASTTVPVTPSGVSTVYPAGAQIFGGASARLVTVNQPLTNTSVNVPWATFDNLTNLTVRCRATPGTTANVSSPLVGTYQVTTTVTTTAGTTTTTTVSKTRNFLTFFADGTFLYGSRTSGGAQGVERGFYAYNNSTGTIPFTVYTDTNNLFPNTVPASALAAVQSGISGLRIPTGGTAPSLTSVVKNPDSPSQITAVGTVVSISGVTNTATTTTANWQLDEPVSTAGQMEGTWATADHRRVYIYNASTTFGSHVGVAGAATFQDACFFLYRNDGTPDYQTPEGYYARRGTSANGGGSTSGGSESSTGCPIGPTTPLAAGAGALSLDYYAPAISQLPGYVWRLPGGQSGADGRSPSPNPFKIVAGAIPGAPETLTISATSNGALIPGTTVSFERTRAN